MIQFHGKLGETQRSAATYFIKRVAERFNTTREAEVARGPEGQVLVTYHAPNASTAKKMRHFMSEISYKVLSDRGVWIVGLPTKAEKVAKRR
jgi:hypothetical protein